MSIGLTVTRRLLGSGVVVQLPSVWRGRDLAPHQLSMKCRRILTLKMIELHILWSSIYVMNGIFSYRSCYCQFSSYLKFYKNVLHKELDFQHS